jgi:hypothetical protein
MSLKKELAEQKMLTANVLNKLAPEKIKRLSDVEYKVFSQWGDDGIIQYLVNNIEIKNKIFVEFGVENYTESNTRYLLQNNNWIGLIMDGSEVNMDYVKRDEIYWKYNLKAKSIFINAENINTLISEEGIKGEIGILHIDIDGNDYWVWKAINVVDPIIVIVEYNSLFGIDRAVTVPYDPTFYRTNAHYSNLYYGVSLLSICDLAEEKGYSFVGCNSAGNNAYFVKNDKLSSSIPVISPEEGYVKSQFKESRDNEGKLTFLSGNERISEIKGMKVFNTRTNKIEIL